MSRNTRDTFVTELFLFRRFRQVRIQLLICFQLLITFRQRRYQPCAVTGRQTANPVSSLFFCTVFSSVPYSCADSSFSTGSMSAGSFFYACSFRILFRISPYSSSAWLYVPSRSTIFFFIFHPFSITLLHSLPCPAPPPSPALFSSATDGAPRARSDSGASVQNHVYAFLYGEYAAPRCPAPDHHKR